MYVTFQKFQQNFLSLKSYSCSFQNFLDFPSFLKRKKSQGGSNRGGWGRCDVQWQFCHMNYDVIVTKAWPRPCKFLATSLIQAILEIFCKVHQFGKIFCQLFSTRWHLSKYIKMIYCQWNPVNVNVQSPLISTLWYTDTEYDVIYIKIKGS